MKMTRPTVQPPNLDRPEVHAYLEGAAASSSEQDSVQLTEKMTDMLPIRISESRRTQKSVQKTKVQQSPAKKSAARAAPNRKELVIPEPIIIDEKAICKFLVDMPKMLRQNIKQKSLDTGISMNQLIITVLTQAFG